jgi:hypothetical protein
MRRVIFRDLEEEREDGGKEGSRNGGNGFTPQNLQNQPERLKYLCSEAPPRAEGRDLELGGKYGGKNGKRTKKAKSQPQLA